MWEFRQRGRGAGRITARSAAAQSSVHGKQPALQSSLLWVLVSVLAQGCAAGADRNDVTWTTTFECEADLERADEVTGRLLAGSCSGRTPSNSQTVQPGEALTPPDLSPGPYGLQVSAKMEGTVIATTCVEVILPNGDDRPLTAEVDFVQSDFERFACSKSFKPSALQSHNRLFTAKGANPTLMSL